ncbi:hypothetical protein O3M35_010779 [Rhynocoris fuscipes]|uniref:Uncharacterized protein n=1 Tax=Rhynocoris fuscipes TaxID=488301 RepID=A0AAW1D2M1_9HEMI
MAVLMVTIVSYTSSLMPDILLEREETNEIQNNPMLSPGRIMVPGPLETEKVACQFDIVKREKISGKCEKLGAAPVCVADRYLHPFHQDCMFTK